MFTATSHLAKLLPTSLRVRFAGPAPSPCGNSYGTGKWQPTLSACISSFSVPRFCLVSAMPSEFHLSSISGATPSISQIWSSSLLHPSISLRQLGWYLLRWSNMSVFGTLWSTPRSLSFQSSSCWLPLFNWRSEVSSHNSVANWRSRLWLRSVCKCRNRRSRAHARWSRPSTLCGTHLPFSFCNLHSSLFQWKFLPNSKSYLPTMYDYNDKQHRIHCIPSR